VISLTDRWETDSKAMISRRAGCAMALNTGSVDAIKVL
jgi:hypothetical protein